MSMDYFENSRWNYKYQNQILDFSDIWTQISLFEIHVWLKPWFKIGFS